MAKKTVQIDREALGVFIDAAESRKSQWADVKHGAQPSMDEFYEADADEAEDMVNMYEAALEKARKALGR